jgi:hypothetical protein
MRIYTNTCVGMNALRIHLRLDALRALERLDPLIGIQKYSRIPHARMNVSKIQIARMNVSQYKQCVELLHSTSSQTDL